MELEVKILTEKVLELSQENAALREINIQFQLDNFKLQQKVKRLEGFSQTESNSLGVTHDPDAEYLDIESSMMNLTSSELEEDESTEEIDGLSVPNPREAAKKIFDLASKRGILDKIKSIEGGKHKDSAYVSKILETVFDKKVLQKSSVCGKKCQSKLYAPARPALDPKKLNICRQAFLYRLKREGLSFQAREDRLKSFNNYVNFKVQNARKLIKK